MNNNLISPSKQLLVLKHNRVKRAYVGGLLLDRWQGKESAGDGNYSEEWLISTVEVTNETKEPGEGLSLVETPNGDRVYLKDIINSDPKAILGADYVDKYGVQIGVLARAGDTIVRIVIQAHPDKESARKYLDFPSGKTEVWYIIDTREVGGEKAHVNIGFKHGITKEKWKRLFDTQNIPGMLDALNKVYVKKGDVILVPAGLPHAIGAGCVFIEIHEPSDYTLRVERDYLGIKKFSDLEIHYGMGCENLFNCFSYNGYTEEEIRSSFFISPKPAVDTSQGKEYDLLTQKETKSFSIKKIVVSDRYSIKNPCPRGHSIGVIESGKGRLEYSHGANAVQSGAGFFWPNGVEGITAVPDGGPLTILLAFQSLGD